MTFTASASPLADRRALSFVHSCVGSLATKQTKSGPGPSHIAQGLDCSLRDKSYSKSLTRNRLQLQLDILATGAVRTGL